MTSLPKITNVDVVEGNLIVVDLSDGRALQITLTQLLAHDVLGAAYDPSSSDV